jgi:RNA methyltransferase, TrmH family
VIESPKNPKIKALLRELDQRALFSVEGEKAVLDAVAAGCEFAEILHDDSIRPGRLASLAHLRPTPVSRAVLERLSDSDTPQHVLALARRRESTVEEVLEGPGPALYVFALQEPGNLGAIIRTAEAVGAAGLLSSPGSADFFHPRCLRASAGSLLRMKVCGRVVFHRAEETARRLGRPLCGALPVGGDDPFENPPPANALLVLGSEGGGLPSEIENRLDRAFTIRMRPPVTSLNVAVAAALMLYAAGRTNQSREAGGGRR